MSIKYTCSLGPICHSSALLKLNNLKKASYPFDWIFTTHSIIREILDNNFDDFMDKNYLISVNNSKCGHKKYGPHMFCHHNPLTNNEHYNYFNRCINRFRDLLINDEEKLFIYIHPDAHEASEKNGMILLNENLKKHTVNFRLLAIFVFPNKETQNYTFTSIDNIDFLLIDTLSVVTGTEFKNPIDNKYISDILKTKYIFELKEIH